MYVSAKQKLQYDLSSANEKISAILNSIGEEHILYYLRACFDKQFLDIEKDIEHEQKVANENKTGAYKSAGNDAKKSIKYLKRIEKEQLALINKLEQVINQRFKIKEIWQKG